MINLFLLMCNAPFFELITDNDIIREIEVRVPAANEPNLTT